MEMYAQDIGSVVRHFSSDAKNGLSDSSAETKLKQYGPNVLTGRTSRSAFKILFGQFTDMLVVLFIVVGLLDFYLGQFRDGTILIAIVIANALIGFYQEMKSENILASMEKLVAEKCKVIRDGHVMEIIVDDLVPGDIVQLYEGDGVPADLRLIYTNGFATNEFILTGESLPADKDAAFASNEKLLIAERKNAVFMGTTVARGSASGIVYATGMQTEIGMISASSRKIQPPKTPTQIEAIDIGKKVLYATLVIGGLLIVTRLILHDPLLPAIVFSVGVAAAMVPEGLPAQISTALALGVQRLSRKKAIVKRIAAVENLGAATVIASDKTGTITTNEMTITGCHFNGTDFLVSGLGYEPKGEIIAEKDTRFTKANMGDLKIFFLSGYLSSTGKINPPDKYHQGWYSIGDPTEAAFATLAMKAGYSLEETTREYPAIKTFEFDSNRKRICIIRNHKHKTIAFVKGAIESILNICDNIIINGKVERLSDGQKQQVIAQSNAYAANALRIIAIAYKDITPQADYKVTDTECNLTFAGFVTMLDPPHEEVKDAIQAVFQAHIKVFMITGDNEVTAKAITKNIGLMNESDQFPEVISGSSLAEMTDVRLAEVFKKRAVIFSRVSTEDKYRIVDLLKKQGEVIAVTGDGVNDTLSLKRADMGVAMGKNGSKVAQEAASMILLDDNFATIVTAVQEGRTIFRNVEKTVITNLSSNIAELMGVLFGFAGAFWGIATPILVMQILAIDMLGEMFPLTALTFDPPEQNIMTASPRNPNNKILTKDVLLGILFRGTVMGLVSYCMFLAEFFHNHHLSNHYEKSTTVMYASILFGQFANVLSNRTSGPALGKYLFSNMKLWIAFGLSVTFMLLIVYVPVLNYYFHTSPLLWFDWLFPITAGALCLWIYELRKKRKQKKVKADMPEIKITKLSYETN
ncbi:MAG: cation-transporting P-type ATPase [Bacteroidetes bacterium]|nr:cation-transporting P-type ATPase [Bacteroidota bacterium]